MKTPYHFPFDDLCYLDYSMARKDSVDVSRILVIRQLLYCIRRVVTRQCQNHFYTMCLKSYYILASMESRLTHGYCCRHCKYTHHVGSESTVSCSTYVYPSPTGACHRLYGDRSRGSGHRLYAARAMGNASSTPVSTHSLGCVARLADS